MIALVVSAVRARTAQAATVLVLTALAVAVAAAAPWYGMAAATRAAAADVAAAPPAQRTLSVRKIIVLDRNPQDALDTFAGAVRGLLAVPAQRPVLGMIQAMDVSRAGASRAITVAYRDDFCDHVRLTGDCPAAAGDAALSQATAQQLGLAPGARFQVSAGRGSDPVTLRLTGTYELRDPAGAYWSNALFRADGGLDPVFVPLAAFEGRQLQGPTLSYDTEVPAALIRGARASSLSASLAAADARLDRQDMRLVNVTGELLDTIARDRATIRRGVLVATIEVLVLAWFAVGLTGRYTGRERRGDAALLKLRGSSRTGMLRLILGQHAVPMAAGAVLGVPIGLLAARLLAGPVDGAADRGAAALWSVVAAAGFLIGGLIVLTVVESAELRRPVAELLRRVAGGRRDWRADVIDLALVAVAVAAVYQARTGGVDAGVGLVAPALAALAVALLLARLLGRVADRAGAAALRTGRLRFGLTAVQLSRQPGTDRVFALIVVAVALLATAAGGWAGTRSAAEQRSAVELGAERVLTVQAAGRTALLRAVRTADPGGREAMAAVVDQASDPQVLAVDSARLGAIARWRPEYGPAGALSRAVAAARVPAPPPPVIGDSLTLDAVNDRRTTASLVVMLQNEATGAPVPVTFGPLGRGEHTVTAPVRGCTAAPGCRFVRFQLGRPATMDTALAVRGLRQADAVVLGAAELGDITRWRSDISGTGAEVSTGAGALTLAMERTDVESAAAGSEAYLVDAPLPLPVVLAGDPPGEWRFTDPTVFSFGNGKTPVRVIGAADVLPVLGGPGILVDLESSRRLSAEADLGGAFQVWLAPDAPRSIVDRLTAAGLTVASDDSVSARSARLARQGPVVAARFVLLAALAGLLIAAAALAVAAAVDRGAQAGQLEALRLQGLDRRSAIAAGYLGLSTVVVAGLLGGLLAAVIAGAAAGTVVPPFTDGWRVIGPPGAHGGPALLAAGLGALVLLGATAAASVLPLARRISGG